MIKKELFTTGISCGTYADFIDNIFSLTEEKKSSYVCFANAHMIVEANTSRKFNDVLNKADIVAPDGKPVSILVNFLYKNNQRKVSGPDIFTDLLQRASACNKRIYFYGSTEKVLQKIIKRARQEYPTLQIVGYHSPPYRELSESERSDIIGQINHTQPDFVFVALGCPKQETWMHEHTGKINACMLGVGQVFQLYAGELKRSPAWMQHAGLEWLYRLCSEPRRLWKRYMYTNSYFMLLVIKHLLFSTTKINLNPELQEHHQ